MCMNMDTSKHSIYSRMTLIYRRGGQSCTCAKIVDTLQRNQVSISYTWRVTIHRVQYYSGSMIKGSSSSQKPLQLKPRLSARWVHYSDWFTMCFTTPYPFYLAEVTKGLVWAFVRNNDIYEPFCCLDFNFEIVTWEGFRHQSYSIS